MSVESWLGSCVLFSTMKPKHSATVPDRLLALAVSDRQAQCGVITTQKRIHNSGYSIHTPTRSPDSSTLMLRLILRPKAPTTTAHSIAHTRGGGTSGAQGHQRGAESQRRGSAACKTACWAGNDCGAASYATVRGGAVQTS